jgi:hypothetical protein
MKYANLGRSGLKISRIGLGCMSFGVESRAWRLDEAASRLVIRHALEHGITFFDTADMYGAGESETALGRALADFARRDEVVIATKLFYPVRPDPNGRGLSRKAVFAAIDASLKRLGTDHVDLYQIHRWDEETPIEETMEALNDVVRAGKVRYLGASSMFAWQLLKAQSVAAANGFSRFVAVQPHYNLLTRRCADPKASASSRGAPWREGGSPGPGLRNQPRTACVTTALRSGFTPTQQRRIKALSKRWARSPACAAFRERRCRSHGCCRGRAWSHRLSVQASLPISMTAWARWTSSSTTRR